MHKVISLFNHKGGVSKTTTTFHLGWMLAEKGYCVVMVDTDPQCNLTGLVLDFESTPDFDDFYSSNPGLNIYDALAPAFKSQPRFVEAVECVQVPERPGLMLIPGHVNLSEYEVTLGIAQELSGSLQALRNLPGAFRFFLDRVAEENQADFIIVDMSPSLSSLNQNFLMTSDFFIVPAAPDFFSVMAIDSLATFLPNWIDWAHQASKSETLRNATYPFPQPTLKFLGTVIQRFRPRKQNAASGFQTWINQINSRTRDRLFPTLSNHGVVLEEQAYESVGVCQSNGYCLAEIADFNSLITISQTERTPVFSLTKPMLTKHRQMGIVLENNETRRNEFHNVFSDLADKVLQLTGHTNA